ncbi:MAG: IS110 family transposase [Parachlamydiaceae bacterium]|nr:IS110 family transposase [Parachlamydiaceae bacterium]
MIAKKIDKSKPNKSAVPKQQKKNALDFINVNAAGIDIGSKSHFVAIPEGRDTECVREFKTFTNSLIGLVSWLKKVGITSVAMESTGVYWIPVYDMLEKSGFDVLLVNAKHIKNVPGRKTDVNDCQWIQQLHTYGLLRGSFRPKDKILKMRTLLRHRSTMIDYASSHIQHVQKSLSLMNIQLNNVIRDVMGATGMKIIRAIIEGERDPEKLAKYRDPNCKSTEKEICESLVGNYQEDHMFCLKQALELYDYYSIKIAECDLEIEKIMNEMESLIGEGEPKAYTKKKTTQKHKFAFSLYEELIRITGVDLTAIPGLNVQSVAKIISEVGVDMSKWETSKQFAAWLGLCPGNKISGGKRLSGKTAPCSNKAAAAFRMGANALRRSNTALGAFFRRMSGRLIPAKAITAAAHKLAVIFYNMLKTGQEYMESGAQYYEMEYRDRCVKSLVKKATRLGFAIVPIEPIQN